MTFARSSRKGIAATLFLLVLFISCGPKPIDWGAYDVLQCRPPKPTLPVIHGKQITEKEYKQWISWGEEWFRYETFGNERLWTDVVGFLNGEIDVPDAGNQWHKEPFFKFFLQSIDALDGRPGNLYQGNGEAYTNDLVITFPPGSRLDKTIPLPERLHTGLDIEAGSAWPIGVVPVHVMNADSNLPYLLDPAKFSAGAQGVGPFPGGKFRVGVTCALCHHSLDIDWDGKPDLKWADLDKPTPGSLYKPQDSWLIGNQDIALGAIFAMSSNSTAGFENSGPLTGSNPADARAWGEWMLTNYWINPEEAKRRVDQGLLLFPRGYADDTPDGVHNPLQFPSLFTHMNWPYNYDGVMLNPSDRNNNVWTAGLDLTSLVALCNDRAGKTAKLVFWQEPGLFSVLTSAQYADMVVANSPAVLNDPAQRKILSDDILGVSDGVPGMLRNDAVVMIDGVPGAVPPEIMNHPDNKKFNRIRKPSDFGEDGGKRGPMVGLLGMRVVTTPEIRKNYGVDSLQKKYGLNPEEFVTEAVSMMLNWVEPPSNHTTLLAKAKKAGLVAKGYEIFKAQGCASCHAGPFFTNNLIVPLKDIGTNSARTLATEPIQSFAAPEYDPSTGLAASAGIGGIFDKLFGSGQVFGYKVVTLRYLWGSAPYLHDGGVGVALKADAEPAGDDLQALLKRPETDKLYGMGPILAYRESHPESYMRPNAALSLQALFLAPERNRVIEGNKANVIPVPGTSNFVSMAFMNVQGIGHDVNCCADGHKDHTCEILDQPGGPTITALVAFLLSLDDDPGRGP